VNFGSRRVAGSEPRADCLPCVLVTCFEIPSATYANVQGVRLLESCAKT